MAQNLEQRIRRRIRKLEDELDKKVSKQDPNTEAFFQRNRNQAIRDIKRLIANHPDRTLFTLILELIDDTAN